MELTDKRFVIVGGAGLIGSHVVEALLREDVGEVVVYDNFVRGTRENLRVALQDPRCSVFEHGGDIMQADVLRSALDGADGVFHLAALWLLHCQDFPRAAFDVNIRGSFNVFGACIDADVDRIVYSSSASVYGEAVEEPMTEDHPLGFENFYGATKVAGEAMLRALHHRFGLDYAGLRYMNVYGPRQDYRGLYMAVIMRMLDSIDRGEPLIVYGDGSQAYDFVHVVDCAEANVCAMKAETTDRFYNIGTGNRTSVKELAELLLELTGSDVGIVYEPHGVSFVKNRIGATERARDEIGFEALVPLADGLRTLVEWRDAHLAELEARRTYRGT